MEIYKSRTDQPLVDWQWHEPSLRNITHLILQSLPETRGRALDVGCGTGRVSFALAEKGYDVTGIDIEERVIEIANKIADSKPVKPRFKALDFGGSKSFEPNYYDLVVCSEVLEHIEDYLPVVHNIYETLKPGGRVIITVPYDPKKWSILDEYGGHVRRYTITQIYSDLHRFSNLKVTVTGFPFYRMVVNLYLWKTQLLKQTHSNETLWDSPSTRLLSSFLYPFIRVDNFFAFTRLGDALIAVGDKAR